MADYSRCGSKGPSTAHALVGSGLRIAGETDGIQSRLPVRLKLTSSPSRRLGTPQRRTVLSARAAWAEPSDRTDQGDYGDKRRQILFGGPGGPSKALLSFRPGTVNTPRLRPGTVSTPRRPMTAVRGSQLPAAAVSSLLPPLEEATAARFTGGEGLLTQRLRRLERSAERSCVEIEAHRAMLAEITDVSTPGEP